MTTNAEAVAALVKSKAALQAECDGASGQALARLNASIHAISSEIGRHETDALNNADYMPATDAFKQATDEAKAFLKTLDDVKAAFGAFQKVAGAIDTVIKLITTLGL